MTGDDTALVSRLKHRLSKRGHAEDVHFTLEYDFARRVEFLSTLTALSVPVLEGEAFGMFLLEAMAAGVPVVQPRLGAFPEIIEKSRCGVLYSPNDAPSLTESLSSLLQDPDRMREMGRNGATAVKRYYSVDAIATTMAEVYEECVSS
jgi:glycosyltransferase involved in cell wall biosynthesis